MQTASKNEQPAPLSSRPFGTESNVRAESLSRPNFFIVGAPKCGTSAWAKYLKSHPGVFVSDIKEPHFFSSDLPGKAWAHSLDEYEALFARAGDARAVGEASVFYLYSERAAEAIRNYNPEAKIIIFLRPQEQLLPALHRQFLFTFAESIEDFESAWRLSGERAPETIPELCAEPKLLDYRAVGQLREQVERFLNAFPPEQILIIRFEDWTRNPRSTYVQLLDFLGVEDDGRTEFPRINPAKAHLSKSLTRFLLYPPRFVQAPVNFLRRITGRKAFGIADWITRFLAKPPSRKSIPQSLSDEIRGVYEKDNAALEERIAGLRKAGLGVVATNS